VEIYDVTMKLLEWFHCAT